MSEEFDAEMMQQSTEENIVSDCNRCQGTGIIMVGTEWNELVEECSCLKNYRENF